MAERISDVPDEADWPEIEEDLVPESEFMPDAGPFVEPFEHLHGARMTLGDELLRPTKVLTVAAARSLLRVADETDTPIDEGKRDTFERFAEGDVAGEQAALVDALGEMAAFVERHLTLGDDG